MVGIYHTIHLYFYFATITFEKNLQVEDRKNFEKKNPDTGPKDSIRVSSLEKIYKSRIVKILKKSPPIVESNSPKKILKKKPPL